MKKIIITVAMLFGMALTNMANEVRISDRVNIEMGKSSVSSLTNIKSKQLGEYLDVTGTDSIKVSRIYEEFCEKFTKSLKIQNDTKRDRAAVKAIRTVIVDMRRELDDTNYRKFLTDLNISMYNNGFLHYSDAYCNKYKN
jgi:hypothetical protein